MFVALLCFALRVGGHAKNVELSLNVAPSRSLVEMLRGEWVSCGGYDGERQGGEFVDKKGKRFSRCMSVLLLPCLSLSLTLLVSLCFCCLYVRSCFQLLRSAVLIVKRLKTLRRQQQQLAMIIKPQ